MKITVLGLGFVGLTTGLGFAKKGFKTYGFDVNQQRLSDLKRHIIPFYEPHLKDVLVETDKKTFFLNVDFEEAIKQSDAIFICVGTPEKEDGSADLTFIFKAIEQVLSVETDKYQVLITKSTVPPSTVSREVIPFVNKFLSSKLSRKVGFASNPEFLREGYCWEDFIEPDRIVIGVQDEKAQCVLNDLYKPFNAPVHFINYNTAEYIKYLSNTLLSTMISYSNEMSMIAEAIGEIDVQKAFKILHEDKRWNGHPASIKNYVYPGCGYGGYCLPKDTAALVSVSEKNGFSPSILKANIHINNMIKEYLADKVSAEQCVETHIGILGLSFKPNSDDIRITPTKDIITRLIDRGFKNIRAYDPLAIPEFKKHYPHLPIKYPASVEELVDAVDVVILLTGWKEFKEKENLIKEKKLYDFRYFL